MFVDTTIDNGSSRASIAYHAPRPRNRKPTSNAKPKPYTQLPTPMSSASSTPSPPPASRWTCMLSGCSKSYGRIYDLERHLVSKHCDALYDADDVTLLATGISPVSLPSLRSKLGRRYVCEACNTAFRRSDLLSRHMDELGHRPITPAPDHASTSAIPIPIPASASAAYTRQLTSQRLRSSTPPAAHNSDSDRSAVLSDDISLALLWPSPAPSIDPSLATVANVPPPISTPKLPDPCDFRPPRVLGETIAPVDPELSDDLLWEDLLRSCAELPDIPQPDPEIDHGDTLEELFPKIWG